MHKDPSIFRISEAVDRFCVSMVSIRFYNLGCSSRDLRIQIILSATHTILVDRVVFPLKNMEIFLRLKCRPSLESSFKLQLIEHSNIVAIRAMKRAKK